MSNSIQDLYRKFVLIIHAVWAIPIILIIYCLRPWRIIRFGDLRTDRIGHAVMDAGMQFAMRQLQDKKYLDFYWLDQKSPNQFWNQMVRRNFPVYWWVYPLAYWNHKLFGMNLHYRPSSATASRDIHGWLEQAPEKMRFFDEENQKAKEWLRKQGWKDGESFVCLLVRDSAYLNSDPMHKNYAQVDHPEYGKGWDYQNYRDSDIATYVPAVEWLADQGVWVFRMGKIMAKPIPSHHPRIIDYAFHPEKSDFLDVWLFANCDLCISTGTGPDVISDVYRKPLLMLNYTPLMNMFSWSNAVHVPKSLIWSESDKLLTWKEYLEHSYYKTNDYSQAGIKVVDMTPDEILAAVQERWQRIQGFWQDTEDDQSRQYRFWQIFKDYLKDHSDFSKYHGWIHPESRVASSWLRTVGDPFLA